MPGLGTNKPKITDTKNALIMDFEKDNRILTDAINMDEWQHSWHINEPNKGGYPTSNPEKVLRIIRSKINERKEQIEKLERAEKVAERYFNRIDK